MKAFRIPFLIIYFFCFCQVIGFTQNNSNSSLAKNVLQQMFDTVYALKNVRFDMYAKERVDGELIQSHSSGVMEYVPRKVFLRGLDTEGVLLNEVLYVEGTNNNNALVSPNGFPYINLNLDPEGSVMRKNRHFTILEAGGRYLVDMLKLGMYKYHEKGDLDKRLSLINEKEYYKITITNFDYAHQTYKVLEGEDSRSIARKLGVPEYEMIELNEDIDSYEDVEPGQTLKVPNFYGRKVELLLRMNDFIPVEVRIFDDKGLYAEYVYKAFYLNVELPQNTFKSENPAYTF